MTMPRRRWLAMQAGLPALAQQARRKTVREILAGIAYTRRELDTFLDPKQPNWARFDPELGHVQQTSTVRNGVDNSWTFTTTGPFWERRMVNYADRPCRINAYGDSFTQGVQVSDGETWPEYLAAHLGEPIRNFGVGGYGVYQAYRRMLREEATRAAAEYVILNIWGMDDHFRSIDAWRWIRFGERWRTTPGYLYRIHANPWVHVRLDLETGALVELPNPYPAPQSLYQLADPEHVYERFRGDPVAQMVFAQRMAADVDAALLKRLADAFGRKLDTSSPEALAQSAGALHVEYALRAGSEVVEKARAFARAKNKKLMVLLSYDSRTVRNACEGRARPDAEFVEGLRSKGAGVIDVLQKHVEDFRAFRLSPAEYVDRYFIGHYKPQGNHFFALAIKDRIVEWLEPKPPAYGR